MPTSPSQPTRPSNLRPISIFTSYMLLCSLLSLLILQNLYRKSSKSSIRIPPVHLHILLATLSLLLTWTHMFLFFVHSYRTWAATQQMQQKFFYGSDAGNLQLGNWLRDSKLFKEAWGTVVETPERLWWSQQIFFWAAGWGVWMGMQGRRRQMSYIWAYMLLGQIVAISFATNLFFIAVLLYSSQGSTPSIEPTSRSKRWAGPWILHTLAIYGTIIATIIIPLSSSSAHFLLLLSIPHILLLLPPIVSSLVPASWHFTDDSTGASKASIKSYYGQLYWVLIGAAFFRQFVTTWEVVASGRGTLRIKEAFSEHPAVSSVGWDVVLCWVSWGMWIARQGWDEGDEAVDEVGKGEERKNK